MDYRTLGPDQRIGIAQQRLAKIEAEHAERTTILAFLRVALAHARSLRERWTYWKAVRQQEAQVRELTLAQVHAVEVWEGLIKASNPLTPPTTAPAPTPSAKRHGKRRSRR